MSEKKCYRVWRNVLDVNQFGGKIVWLTDNELIMHVLQNNFHFTEIVDPAVKKTYRIYMNQKVYKD